MLSSILCDPYPLSFLLPLTQRSSTGGQLVDSFVFLGRWGRFIFAKRLLWCESIGRLFVALWAQFLCWLDKSVIEGTDEPSRIFLLQIEMPIVAYAPSNEEVCTVDASPAQFARAVHTWKSGHYFFDHFVCGL